MPIALSEADLWLWVHSQLGVSIPFEPVCPGHCSPWDVFRDAFFAVHPVMVVKASRGFGGKSFNMSTLGITEATLLGAEVNVLGGSGQQAQRVLDTMARLWDYESAPRDLITADSLHVKALSNGGRVQALMASQKSVRGPHPQRLRIDEVDEMDLALLDAALGQPMTRGDVPAQVLISSTHQHSDGTMTECLKRVASRGWKRYEYCFRETQEPRGWLSAHQIALTRSIITEEMWQTEYEGQEPNPGARAIPPAAVEAMFRTDLGTFRGADGEYIEIEPPQQGASYSHGADWAKKVDRTIISTLRTDCRPAKLVAFEAMRRLPWPVMVNKFENRVTRYGGNASHDATGIGDVVHDQIHRAVAEPVILVGRERQDTLTEYFAACERGEIVAPRIDLAYSEHKYASVDDVYGSGHLPDTMCANALAYRAGFRRFRAAWASA